MTKLERAKIFMPFDALKGFRAALKAKEQIKVCKKEFAEDYLEELDQKLKSAQIGQMVKVVYYQANNYYELVGILTKIDYQNKLIKIVKKEIRALDIIIFDIIEDTILK